MTEKDEATMSALAAMLTSEAGLDFLGHLGVRVSERDAEKDEATIQRLSAVIASMNRQLMPLRVAHEASPRPERSAPIRKGDVLIGVRDEEPVVWLARKSYERPGPHDFRDIEDVRILSRGLDRRCRCQEGDPVACSTHSGVESIIASGVYDDRSGRKWSAARPKAVHPDRWSRVDERGRVWAVTADDIRGLIAEDRTGDA